MVLNIILWVLFGAIAGWAASVIVGNPRHSIVSNVVIGIVGAIIGGWIVRIFGGSGITGFNLGSLLTAILGAVVLLFVVNLVSGRTHHRV
jgi:uncharacterized membrane protein YeaQ/YmgE (transglycosylase-associated protein family)